MFFASRRYFEKDQYGGEASFTPSQPAAFLTGGCPLRKPFSIFVFFWPTGPARSQEWGGRGWFRSLPLILLPPPSRPLPPVPGAAEGPGGQSDPPGLAESAVEVVAGVVKHGPTAPRLFT